MTLTTSYEIRPLKTQKRPKPKKRKTGTRSQLIRMADKLMSLYVRRFYADKDGIVKCFTCDYMAHWKHMQNGHYITRSRYWTRWFLFNTRPQCFVCNMRYQGMSHLFRAQLVGELGEKAVLNMEEISKKENKEFTDEQIQFFIDDYQRLLTTL